MRDPHSLPKTDFMEDENKRIMIESLSALKVLAEKKQLFFELSTTDFIEKLSGLLDVLDKDWVGKSQELQSAFSYFIVNQKYTKEEMQQVAITITQWYALVVNVVQYTDFIQNLHYLLEQVMIELKEENKVSIPNN